MAVTFAEEQATETKKDKRGIYGGYGTYGYSSYAAPISQAVSVVTKEVPVPVPHPVAVPVEKHVPVPVKVNIVLPFHAKKKKNKWKKHDYEIFTIARVGKSLVTGGKRRKRIHEIKNSMFHGNNVPQSICIYCRTNVLMRYIRIGIKEISSDEDLELPITLCLSWNIYSRDWQ